MAKRLNCTSTKRPTSACSTRKTTAAVTLTCPEGIGRERVRSTRPSMSRSTRSFQVQPAPRITMAPINSSTMCQGLGPQAPLASAQSVARQRVEGAAAWQLGRLVIGNDRPAERIAQGRYGAWTSRRGTTHGVANADRGGVVGLHLRDDIGRHTAKLLVGFEEGDHLGFFDGEALEDRTHFLTRR